MINTNIILYRNKNHLSRYFNEKYKKYKIKIVIPKNSK